VDDITFRITTTRFDEDYTPATGTRATTNFANLARGEDRRENLRNALTMIEHRFNELAAPDDDRARYRLELDIVSVSLRFADGDVGDDEDLPAFEMLQITIVDVRTGERHPGIIGNNFSSYLRDYDFSIRLPAADAGASIPDDFGDLHGALFQHFLDSAVYRERFPLAPVICISVSTSRTYHRTGHVHPVLGVEYAQDSASLTDAYFAKMGLQVRYFLPRGASAPLAFYFRGDLLGDYTPLQLIGTIATMETFQKIYRPEIYNAHSPAGEVYRPSLEHADFTRTQVEYDRVERSQLAVIQGRYAEEHFVTPHRELLDRWAADHAVAIR
jgi:hypothetical protein